MKFPHGKPFDVVGLGLNAVDHLMVVPEHPVPRTVTPILADALCGGGQVATALVAQARLGLRVKYVGKVGDDDTGAWSVDTLRRSGVDVGDVVTVCGQTSQSAFILVAQHGGERTICWRRGAGLSFALEDWRDGQLTQGRLLHIDTHEIARNIQAAEQARACGIPVLIDAETLRPRAEELLRLCDIVVSDAGFARQLTGHTEPARQLAALRDHTDATVLALTLGPHGSMAWCDGQVYAAPGYPVEVVDTTGAGDVYHGAFGYGLLRGWPLDQVCRFANALAAMSCRGLGGRSALATLEEVAQFLGQDEDQDKTWLPPDARTQDAWAFAREALRGRPEVFAAACQDARSCTDPEAMAVALLHPTLVHGPVLVTYLQSRFGHAVAARVETGN